MHLLQLGHELLLRLGVHELDGVRDLVVARVEVQDQEGLDCAELVLLLEEQDCLVLLGVLDVLQDLDLLIEGGEQVTSDQSADTHVDGLVTKGGAHLLCDLELASIVLLADAERGREQVVLGIASERGLNGGGVPFALCLNELLGKRLLLLATHGEYVSGGLWDKVCCDGETD